MIRKLVRSAALLLVILPTFSTLVRAGDAPIEIGSRRELFVDKLLIERMRGSQLRLHHPVKAARPASPLPERHMMTVIRDGERFRAWWRGTDPAYTGELFTGHPGETVHYAESHDGREWTFPQLRLHQVGGTRANNVALAGQPPFLTNFMPFLDTNPRAEPGARYKALAGHPGPGDKRGQPVEGKGLFAFVSPDGIHWEKRGEVIPYQPRWRHAFDSPNVAFWSPAEQRYVCYFRTWTDKDRLRSISRATSPDFEHWSDPVEMHPNLPGEHLYTNMTHPYFRAPHIYIALPTRFLPGRGDAPRYDERDVNATDILFMSTRAGSARYDRTFTEAFIRPGMDPDRWRNRANYVAQNVQSTGPAEISIYHRSGDRYVLRTDGFISLHAGAAEGEVVTKPLVFAGKQLEVNLSTSAAGSLRVEMQTVDGTPVPGFTLRDCPPVYGDALDLRVHWSSERDLASLAGRPVRLRLVLKECDLYSFRFRH